MRRKELINHLRKCGCHLVREGARHSVFYTKSVILSSRWLSGDPPLAGNYWDTGLLRKHTD
ncbi:MAG: hypothetical protein QME51_10695 [Planctomycetota bacterium]|nr:hypothetical protein [Planctomycetota bacterium]